MKKQSSCFFSATQLMMLLFLTMAIPSVPAFAATRNEFQTCAKDIVGAGIPSDQAATACAGVLHPQELSDCVVKIKQVTPSVVSDAVRICYQARRPLDLATCVNDISRGVPNAMASNVLDYCRRSLLPTRFSECVVGLNRSVNFSAPQAMDTCISARDMPYQLFPQEVPSQVPPTSPIPPQSPTR